MDTDTDPIIITIDSQPDSPTDVGQLSWTIPPHMAASVYDAVERHRCSCPNAEHGFTTAEGVGQVEAIIKTHVEDFLALLVGSMSVGARAPHALSRITHGVGMLREQLHQQVRAEAVNVLATADPNSAEFAEAMAIVRNEVDEG